MVLTYLTRNPCLSILLTCYLCGCAHPTLSDTPFAPVGPKLAAFRKVVATYKQSPGDFASDKERYQHNDELQVVQDAFVRVPFDASTNRKEAEAILRLWQSELEGRYSGELPRVLEIEILRIHMDIRMSE